MVINLFKNKRYYFSSNKYFVIFIQNMLIPRIGLQVIKIFVLLVQFCIVCQRENFL